MNLISLKGSLIVGIGIAALAVGICVAAAHDAPTGWSYPFACCSNADCREVGEGSSSKVSISETPLGYKISTTGEVISYADSRIKDSPDGEFHWCSVAGKDDSRTLCLFVPPRAF